MKYPGGSVSALTPFTWRYFPTFETRPFALTPANDDVDYDGIST